MIVRYIIAASRPGPVTTDERTPVVVITPHMEVETFRLRPGYPWPGADMTNLPFWCDDFILRRYPALKGKLHGSIILDSNEHCFAAGSASALQVGLYDSAGARLPVSSAQSYTVANDSLQISLK